MIKVSTVGGIDNVVITKPLISSVKLAFSRFKVATRVHDEEIKEVENEKLKRKNAIKRIGVLKKQKVDLLTEKFVGNKEQSIANSSLAAYRLQLFRRNTHIH